MKAIFVLGPPYSGKDTAYKLAAGRFGCIRAGSMRKFAGPLKHYVHMMLFNGESVDAFEGPVKDQPQERLNGHTIREAYIDLSENFIKKYLGREAFGHLMVRDLRKLPNDALVWITDSGFPFEAQPVIGYLGVENCLQLCLRRSGCDFQNDSRSYWSFPGLDQIWVSNEGSLEDFSRALEPVFEWAELCESVSA